MAALNERATAEAAIKSSSQQLRLILQQKKDADKRLAEWKLKAEAAAKRLGEEQAKAREELAKAEEHMESFVPFLLCLALASFVVGCFMRGVFSWIWYICCLLVAPQYV